MSYRFERGETVSDGIKRIALEQLDTALELTAAPADKLDLAIHDLRVASKKLRGLLRLLRYEMDGELYQAENIWYRDFNRRLSSLRDHAALVEALDKLQERFAEQLFADAFASVRQALSHSTEQEVEIETLQSLAQEIAAARLRVEQWPPVADDFSALSRGLQRVYKQGLRKFTVAYEEQTVAAFHEWRKEIKYYWYHIRLLQPLWPGPLKQLAGELKMLSRYLSEHHDLAMLSEKMLTLSIGGSAHADAEALLALSQQRQRELEALARVVGERVYAEEPAAFKRRFKEYWRSWRAAAVAPETETEADQET